MKNDYVVPVTEVIPCREINLMGSSNNSVPFDPGDGTTEALSKANDWDFVEEEQEEEQDMWTRHKENRYLQRNLWK